MKVLFSVFITIIIVCFTNCDESDTITSRIEGNVFESGTNERLDSANVVVFEITEGSLWVSGISTHTIQETISNAQGFYSLLLSLRKGDRYYIGAKKSGYFSSTGHNSPYTRGIGFVDNQRIDLSLLKMNP